MTKKQTIYLLAAVFLGFALGFFTHGRVMRYRFQNFERDLPQILARKLDLDEGQSSRVKEIVENSFKEFEVLKSEIRPRMRELQLSTRGKISEVLNEAQKSKFQRFTDKLDKRQEERTQEGGSSRGSRRLPF